MPARGSGLIGAGFARAHGMWTYEPRQGRNAATVVCSTFAVVTLAFESITSFSSFSNALSGLLDPDPMRESSKAFSELDLIYAPPEIEFNASG